ncbi:MAG TPA: hypothetical protein VLK34_02655, partial [Nocardioidaceae bacterium]|nr:hypothetical protein [Nocardioidaceae bacterium]
MTQHLSDDSHLLCVLCGQAPGDTSPLDRSADSGPMILAVHSDGTACGYVVHDLCVRYVRAHGPLADVDCLCGRGPVVEGIPRASPVSDGVDTDAMATVADALPEDSDGEVENDLDDSSEDSEDDSAHPATVDQRTCAACKWPLDDAPLGLQSYER